MNMNGDFVRARGPEILDAQGEPFLLRGVGLGSWLLPEGYMWKMPAGGDRPRRIEKMIRDLAGAEEAEKFWKEYRDVYVSRDDILRIAAEGFNSVRIPLNYRILEESLSLVDRMIGWCRESGLYVILDLHGAPGGQTGANIDDSENDLPELFTDAANRQRTIDVWRMLAARYREETCIAGYDLLNEPLPDHFSQYNHLLMPLYRDIIRAVREEDPHHMIILEGLHWATDWSLFTDKPDENLMLQFHKYWNNPDRESIQKFLDKRTELDVPIFMGEGGENNIGWYAGAFRLFEDLDISWNFWTWKKMDTTNSPCSIDTPAGWNELSDYLEGGPRPELPRTLAILRDYLDKMQFRNCTWHQDVVNAILRKPPLTIPAIFYSFRQDEAGFSVRQRRESKTGFRAGDGTDIRFTEGSREKANFAHGQGQAWQADERLCVWVHPGEWFSWDFTLQSAAVSGDCTITFSISAPEGPGRADIFLDGLPLGLLEAAGTPGDPAPSVQYSFSPIKPLEAGEHRIVLRSESGIIRLEWIRIAPAEKKEGK